MAAPEWLDTAGLHGTELQHRLDTRRKYVLVGHVSSMSAIPCGGIGYVVLYEIECRALGNVLAGRHQLLDDSD